MAASSRHHVSREPDVCAPCRRSPTVSFLLQPPQPPRICAGPALQVYEMVNVRHGLMVVGYSYAGKSSALKSLSRGLTTLAASGLERKTHLYCMNPKSITMGQLYGQNDVSMEWNDGILSKIFRSCAHDAGDERKWLVLDGVPRTGQGVLRTEGHGGRRWGRVGDMLLCASSVD